MDILESWVAQLLVEGKSAQTLRSYRSVVSRYMASGLTPFRFLMQAQAKGCNPASIALYIRVLRRWELWLERQGLGTPSLNGLKVPRVRPQIVRPFTGQEITRLLEVCAHGFLGERDRAIILFLLDSGLRASELLSLAVADLGADGRVRVQGKGSKWRMVRVGARTLAQVEMYLSLRRVPSPALWVGINGVPLHVRGLGSRLCNLGKKAGVHCHPHRFRHTFATFCLLNGADCRLVQELLGHATPAQTQRYTQAVDSMWAVERFSSFGPVDRLLSGG